MKVIESYKHFDYELPEANEVVEILIDEDDIKHWIDMEYSPKQIIELARTIYPDSLEDNDLDKAYEVLISDYEEIDELADYIEDCVYETYKYEKEAYEELENAYDLDEFEKEMMYDFR